MATRKLHSPATNTRYTIPIGEARRRLRCLFVLSTGRVGTATLARLLALSPEIRARHEPVPRFLEWTKRAYQQPGSGAGVPQEYLIARLTNPSTSGALLECLTRRLIYVETSNRLTLVAAELSNYFPDSRFIHLHRHPADVVRSMMRRRAFDGQGWDAFRIEPRRDDRFASEWSGYSPFEKCCWLWQAVNAFALEFLRELPPERRFSLPSEVLFGGDADGLTPLFDWLGVDGPDASAVSDVLAARHNAQHHGEFPEWAEWADAKRETMAVFVRSVAEQLGYDLLS